MSLTWFSNWWFPTVDQISNQFVFCLKNFLATENSLFQNRSVVVLSLDFFVNFYNHFERIVCIRYLYRVKNLTAYTDTYWFWYRFATSSKNNSSGKVRMIFSRLEYFQARKTNKDRLGVIFHIPPKISWNFHITNP